MKTLFASFILVISVLAIAEDDKNLFKNPSVGFAVAKPSDWEFVTADQRDMENLVRTNLGDKLGDKQVEKALQENPATPFVVIAKNLDPLGYRNPSVKVTIKPLGDLPGNDPLAIIKLMFGPIPKLLEDCTVDEEPSETSISGMKAAHFRIHYSLKTPDGSAFPTSSELWIIPRGKFYFMVGAGTPLDEKTGGRADIHKIISSIRIERQNSEHGSASN